MDKWSSRNLFLLFVVLRLMVSIAQAEEFRLTQTTTINLPANATAMAWHPTSKALAVGGWIGMFAVWDSETGRLIRNLEQAHRPVIGDMQYSKDGKYLASGKSMSWAIPPYLSIFDASTFQLVDTLAAPTLPKKGIPPLYSLSFDPNNSKRIALSGYENGNAPVVFTIGSSADHLIRLVPEMRHTVEKVAFSPDGKTIAVGRANGELSLHSADNGERITSFSAFDDWVVAAMIFSNDGQAIFAASNTGAGRGGLEPSTGKWNDRVNTEPIKMWDAKSLHLVQTFNTEGRAVKSLDTSPDGRYLFAGLSKGLIVAWNVMTGREAYRFRPFKNFVILKLSPDGKRLAAMDTGTTEIKIWTVGSNSKSALH
ncbi:MAG: hypothetical protein WCA83_08570 [Azonexus sp.]